MRCLLDTWMKRCSEVWEQHETADVYKATQLIFPALHRNCVTTQCSRVPNLYFISMTFTTCHNIPLYKTMRWHPTSGNTWNKLRIFFVVALMVWRQATRTGHITSASWDTGECDLNMLDESSSQLYLNLFDLICKYGIFNDIYKKLYCVFLILFEWIFINGCTIPRLYAFYKHFFVAELLHTFLRSSQTAGFTAAPQRSVLPLCLTPQLLGRAGAAGAEGMAA